METSAIFTPQSHTTQIINVDRQNSQELYSRAFAPLMVHRYPAQVLSQRLDLRQSLHQRPCADTKLSGHKS